MDIFDEKGIQPMLIAEQVDPFDSEDYIYEIKLDGIRCVAYLEESGTDLRNKRDKAILQYVPELSSIHTYVNCKCILDGELFVLKDGRTDFYEIQRRVMTNNVFKIQHASEVLPASFVAYDILYKDGQLLDNLSLLDRKEILSSVISENARISVARYISTSGSKLFELAKGQGLEGVVAKKKDSLYMFGKRSKQWKKIKVMNTDDCIICGYICKSNNMTSLVLGQYALGKIVYRGHVTLGVSLSKIRDNPLFKQGECVFEDPPRGNEAAIWLCPLMVCIVEYMPSDQTGFRQPVFKGLRDDKAAQDCKVKNG